jgi:hypothetical protein
MLGIRSAPSVAEQHELPTTLQTCRDQLSRMDDLLYACLDHGQAHFCT